MFLSVYLSETRCHGWCLLSATVSVMLANNEGQQLRCFLFFLALILAVKLFMNSTVGKLFAFKNVLAIFIAFSSAVSCLLTVSRWNANCCRLPAHSQAQMLRFHKYNRSVASNLHRLFPAPSLRPNKLPLSHFTGTGASIILNHGDSWNSAFKNASSQ